MKSQMRALLSIALTMACFATACTSLATQPEREITPASTSDRFRDAPIVPEPAFGKAGPGWFSKACAMPIEYVRRIRRGYRADRAPDIVFVSKLPHNFGSPYSARHDGPFEFLVRVPLVFYGPGHVPERGRIALDREATVADIAPTVASLIGASWPEGRPGRVIEEALLPESERPDPPKLVVTVVWDGGGWNTLDTWPEKWPFLAEIMERGTVVTNATVGSSPSVTMPVHATIGTGAFPRRHGIVNEPIRVNGRLRAVYGNNSPRYLDTTTLADEFDIQTRNRSKVGLVAARNWHLGLIGHGGYLEGADRDIAPLIDTNKRKSFYTNEDYYRLPPYVAETRGLARDTTFVDMLDGRRDGHWLRRPLRPDGLFNTPVWDLFQTRVIRHLIAREGFGADDVPDLMYTNYKQIDHLGHYFNMLSREVGVTIRTSDIGLRRLSTYLDNHVGPRNWVLVLTADHGQAPHPTVVDGWGISADRLGRSVEKRFRATGLVERTKPDGLWLNPDVMAATRVGKLDVVRFLLGYRLKDNAAPGVPVRPPFKDDLRDRLFAAAFPSDRMERVWRCAQRRADG